MINTKEIIKELYSEDLTEIKENELLKKLHSRTEEQIIQDLKERGLDNLLNAQECIESAIESNSELDTEEVRKSLSYLHKAIKLTCSDLIQAEKDLKELLCNC